MHSIQSKDVVATNRQFLDRDATWPYFAVTAPIFDTGVDTIDIQHRMLIGRLEALERTVGFPLRAFSCRSLENFADLAVKHLCDEKRLLDRMNYPALDDLQREHEWNLITLERICEEFRRGDIDNLPAAIESVWQWTIEHIIESDSRYLPFRSRFLARCALDLEERTGAANLDRSHCSIVRQEKQDHEHPRQVETA